MADDDDPEIAVGTPVKFKSKLGYTYEGTITVRPGPDGRYTITTGEGAVAMVDREAIILDAPAGADDDDPDLTPEQRKSLRGDRARQHANSRVADAMQSVYVTLREDTRRELGEDVEGDALDDLRLQAVDLVVAEAEALRDGIARSVEAKRG